MPRTTGFACLLVCLATTSFASPKPDALHAGDHREGSLEAGGNAHFSLTMARGGFAHVLVDQVDLDVVVTVTGPDGKPVGTFDSSGKGEAEDVAFAGPVAGDYDLQVASFDPKATGRFAVRVDALLDAAGYAQRQREESARDRQARDWIAAHAIELKGADPELPLDDMKQLAPLVGDARVVLMGEATHGTREFFQLKHRMLEYLVQEKGFNVFAIEATMPEAYRVNRYVLDGEGDPAKALEGMYFWTWDTEEVYRMIQWMRRWNADPAHVRKLKFYGFDAQSPQLAVRNVVAYLARVDTGVAATTRADFAVVADAWAVDGWVNRPAPERARLLPVAQALLQRFDAGKADWSARTSPDAWELARQNAMILVQFASMNAGDDQGYSVARAKAMADNLLWIAAHEGPDAKVMGWAHNAHVWSGRPPGYTYDEMGTVLRAALGDRLRVFGFAFAQGGFQSTATDANGGLHEYQVSAPADHTLDAVFDAVGKPLFVLDLHALPSSGPVFDWFAQPRATRSIGSVFDPSQASAFADRVSAPKVFDALIFVDRTSAARPMPMGRRAAFVALEHPANLDFERGEAGDLPSEWSPRNGEGVFGYQAVVSTERPHGGKSCGEIERLPGPEYGPYYGKLLQVFDATPYRGHRVRVHAWMRAEVVPGEGRGHLAALVRSDSGNVLPPPDVAKDANYLYPVVDRQWQERTIEVVVGKDAKQFEIDAVLVGNGKVFIDDVSIETLPEQAGNQAK